MKRIIIAVVALATTPIVGQTIDFTDPILQCTGTFVTQDATENFANTPIGKLGYNIVYLKDLKEVSRSKDKLSCSATVVFNVTPPGASSDAVPYKIEFLNMDGHALISMQRDDELARVVARALKARDDLIAEAIKQAEKKPTPPKPKKPTPSPTANSSYLAQSWIGAFRERVETCWDLPTGSLDVADVVVNVHVQFNRDGSLAAEPVVVNSSSNPNFRVAAEASVRAIRRCAPYAFLPQSQYNVWQDFEVVFVPREMFRGTTASQ
jgi:hypothetical protein